MDVIKSCYDASQNLLQCYSVKSLLKRDITKKLCEQEKFIFSICRKPKEEREKIIFEKINNTPVVEPNMPWTYKEDYINYKKDMRRKLFEKN